MQYNCKHITSSLSNSPEYELLETVEKLLGEFYNKKTSLALNYKKNPNTVTGVSQTAAFELTDKKTANNLRGKSLS